MPRCRGPHEMRPWGSDPRYQRCTAPGCNYGEQDGVPVHFPRRRRVVAPTDAGQLTLPDDTLTITAPPSPWAQLATAHPPQPRARRR